MLLQQLVSRVRPAPLQSAIAHGLRLNTPRVVAVGEMRLEVDPMSIGGRKIIAGSYEPEMTRVVSSYLRPGDTFIDLGANLGYFSVLGARLVGPRGCVIAVEPQSRLQELLMRNLQLNECYNARLVQAVVSAERGEATLHLTADTNSGGSSLYRPTRYRLATERVRSWTFEDLVDRVGADTVHLVKIDIEGAEYDVLMSSGALLRSGRLRVLAVDFHESILQRRGLSSEPVVALLRECGYDLNGETGAFEHEAFER